MKRFMTMIFSVLLVAFLSTSFTNTKSYVDKDVGYSLTLDQNVTVIPTIESPVISGESSILLTRGVSVPYLGLINQDVTVINNNPGQFEMVTNYGICLAGNHKYRQNCLSSTDNTTIELIGNIPAKQLRGVTRLDIGENCYRQNIV